MAPAKPKLAVNSKTLLIIPCCATKQSGGKPEKNCFGFFNFNSFWDTEAGELIHDSRLNILDQVQSGIDPSRRDPKELINRKIKKGNDFGCSDENGLYLPAFERYIGSLYIPEKLHEEAPKTLPYVKKYFGDDDHPKILILSALYGPLHPFECIQNYNLKMGYTPAKNIWAKALIKLLRIYVEKVSISKIVLYAGSTSDYLRVLKPAVGELLSDGLVSNVLQYHIENGNAQSTPRNHGRIFYSDFSQGPCDRLDRDVEIREGPEFLPAKYAESEQISSKTKSEQPNQPFKTDRIDYKLIPYTTRSSFLELAKVAIREQKQQVLLNNKVSFTLEKPGGYKGDLEVRVLPSNQNEFSTNWSNQDITRFPARIRAVASALHELGINGCFKISHEDGEITISQFPKVEGKFYNGKIGNTPSRQSTTKLRVESKRPDAHMTPTSSYPAHIFRDRRELSRLVEDSPGVYGWWFPVEVAQQLSIPIESCTQDEAERVLLYVGIGKSLRDRLDWHINQKHSDSTIKAGVISTFRFTLCALLKGVLQNEPSINETIDQLWVRFEYTDTKYSAEAIEDGLMSSHCLPLNIQRNSHPFIPKLLQLRADCKSASLGLINSGA